LPGLWMHWKEWQWIQTSTILFYELFYCIFNNLSLLYQDLGQVAQQGWMLPGHQGSWALQVTVTYPSQPYPQ
jgi:hypothetical protein